MHIGSEPFHARTIELEGSTIALADVNGDERVDLVSAGRRLTVHLGDGAGGLRSHSNAPAGAQPVDFALADVNEDGRVDILIANHETDYLTLLVGDGRGGLAPADPSPLRVDVDPHPHAVAAADLDGDERPDLLVDHSPRGARTRGLRTDPGGVLVRRALGDGLFEPTGVVMESGGVPYRGFALGDLNGDGRPDLVTPLDREIGVLLNTSESGRISFRRLPPVAADTPFVVRLGDLNADGHLDVISGAGEESSLVEVFMGDGRGGFAAAEQSPMRFARGGKNIELGDFNGDGVIDAAVVAYRSDEVLIVLGGAEFLETTFLPAGQAQPWGLAAGDLNADGADDLVVAGAGSRQGRVYLSQRP